MTLEQGIPSLSYLRSFPFDKIKIDRSFIDDLAKGDEAVAIVQAILDLASALHMKTTAEGVETDEQKKLLEAIGATRRRDFCSAIRFQRVGSQSSSI